MSIQGYIDEVEERYHGIFLFRDEARKLMLEVREAFRGKRKGAWGGNG